MKTVAIGRLKDRLSEWVRVAQSGERITVTSRGIPAIDLAPLAVDELERDEEFLSLMRAGRVRLPHAPDERRAVRTGPDPRATSPTPK